MRQVADSVHRLGSKHHNFYVVHEGGKATIVDSGASRDYAALERALASLGLTFEGVEVMVITHAHTDHMGSARTVATHGVEVRGHAAEVPVLAGTRPVSQIKITDLPLWKPAVWPFLLAMIRHGAVGAAPVPAVHALSDGEIVDAPGRPQVVHTPGHTPGHAAYYLGERQILFSGDALVTRSPAGGPQGPQFLGPAFHADPEQAQESLQRLASLDTRLVLPGHGDPWPGQVANAVEAART